MCDDAATWVWINQETCHKPPKNKFGNRNGVWKMVIVVAKMRINAHLS
jgi:hypothetical protein